MPIICFVGWSFFIGVLSLGHLSVVSWSSVGGRWHSNLTK